MGDSWNKDSTVIFERFAAGIDEAVCRGVPLTDADRDLQYGIRLQQERLQRRGIEYSYDLTPRGHFTEGLNLGSRWSDGRYENKLETRTCLKQERFARNGKVLFRKKQNAQIFQTVTNVKDPKDVAEEEYVCPDCGAVTKVGLLLEGCPYCRNRFRMDELYPKISNYYFYPDVGGTRKELGKIAIPTILITIVVIYLPFLLFGGILLLIGALTSVGNPYQAMQTTGDGIGILISGIFCALFFGIIGGWVITTGFYLFRFGAFAADRIPMAKYIGSQKQFEDFMKQSTPEFSYEFFAGKTISLIRMMIFSEDATELPFYNGRPLDPAYREIIDINSMGCVGITKMEISEGYVLVHADVYLEDTYDTNGKIRRKKDIFRVVMKKNVSKPVNFGFRITSIHCPSCAGSFDATRHKTCPYCGNLYHLEDLDWAVEALERIR